MYFSISRVLTGKKSGSRCSILSAAEPDSIWDRIFRNHMTLDDGCIGTKKAIKKMQESDQLFTTFSSIQDLGLGYIPSYLLMYHV